ncbi:outer membrane protein, cobalt-zinc-cadmium efflux system [Chryseobacterium carnipullorum]|uniref:TolC family protein n=1 Tax=Chryseobacterium carnipullorum TaxID=1124835 RepID=UPI0009174952|nr:TolC family protein [Chryseobacterium carnipullorum]SHM33266.1 outer membrane protein, cobalt-zinc-cadmium efflux system [Chryseobacterium carnipullorum]
MKSKIIFTISLGLLFQISVNAQEKETLNFASYLSEVREKNLNYAAQKYNVSMTEASILTAGLFPDPQLEMETSDNGVSKKMGYTIGTSVNWTLELGHKRKARIETAKNQAEYSKLQLQDFLRNLIADASVGYIEALKTKALVDIQKDSYLSMHQLATSDSIRYRLGAISQVTSRQSKLEASSLLNDLYKAESISRQSFSALFIFLGTDQQEKEISGNFKAFNRDFNSEDLILEAVNTRSDLLASKQNIHTAASLIKLEKANRIIDLGLSVGVEHSTWATNEIAPSPAVNAIKLGASIPLKFSNRRNADLKIAEIGRKQAETEYKQIENSIRTEVMQAYYQYQATQKQLKQFDNGMLSEAKSILDGIIYSYQRGESSILEVLNAQRTYNDIRQRYIETLADNAVALIELERKTGIWDIDF